MDKTKILMINGSLMQAKSNGAILLTCIKQLSALKPNFDLFFEWPLIRQILLYQNVCLGSIMVYSPLLLYKLLLVIIRIYILICL